MDYLLIVISTVLVGLDMVCAKTYQAREGADVAASLKFNMVNGLLTALVFFGFSGFKFEFSLFSLGLALLSTIFVLSYSLIGFYVLRVGNMAMYSIFLMCGGMLLPYVFGITFLHEPLSVFKIIGVFVILAGVLLSNKAKYEVKASLFLLYLAVFLLNGLVSIVSKCHQIGVDYTPVSSTNFVAYSGLLKTLLCCIALPFVKKTIPAEAERKTFFSRKTTVLIVLCSVILGGAAYALQLVGAKTLPASVLFPMAAGCSIICCAVSGMIFFKEKLSLPQIISIGLCLTGAVMFL